jgi:hypothetical protein
MKEGRLEDQKAFIRTLVARIDLNPVDKTAIVWVWPIPQMGLPGEAASIHGAKALPTLLEKINSAPEPYPISVNGEAGQKKLV